MKFIKVPAYIIRYEDGSDSLFKDEEQEEVKELSTITINIENIDYFFESKSSNSTAIYFKGGNTVEAELSEEELLKIIEE